MQRMRPWVLAVPLITLASLVGCSAEGPPSGQVGAPPQSQSTSSSPASTSRAASQGNPHENRPAVVLSARITPSPLVLSGPVAAVVEAQDPEGQPVTVRHQWLVNGKPVQGQTGPTLAPELLKRGDRVRVEVVPSDPNGGGTPYRTDEIRVVNTPPDVTGIRFEPFPPRVGDRVVAHIEGVDADDDEVSYRFRWIRNGEVVDEEGEETVETTDFQRGDELVLEVTPHDGTEAGQMHASEAITIANTSPRITSRPPGRLGVGQYVYQVTASDRDGDQLTYALETAPPGMTIDPKTGLLQWQFGSETKGTHPVRLTVNDGHEEEPPWQEFELVLDGRSGGEG